MDQNIEYGRKVLRLESEVIAAQEPLLDERFGEAVEMVLACKGQVITTGMGKSGLIARKISATLASTGTRSIYLHPAEAVHGDLGRVHKDDLLLALSRSGDTDELRRLSPLASQSRRCLASQGRQGLVLLARQPTYRSLRRSA